MNLKIGENLREYRRRDNITQQLIIPRERYHRSTVGYR